MFSNYNDFKLWACKKLKKSNVIVCYVTRNECRKFTRPLEKILIEWMSLIWEIIRVKKFYGEQMSWKVLLAVLIVRYLILYTFYTFLSEY